MAQVLFDGQVFADYFQIYLRDEGDAVLPTHFTQADLATRLIVGPHAVILMAPRNMMTPIRVEWSLAPPDVDFSKWQHVVDSHFDCPTGRLVLAGVTDYEPTATRLTVRPGALGVRASFAGLDTISPNGLEGEDHCLVQLWPGGTTPGAHVLKLWR